MYRLIAAAAAALAIGGCYTDAAYVQDDYGYSYGGVAVSTAPPPLQYEAALPCDGAVWVPGSWDWSGSWVWRSGSCMPYQSGYVYNQPYYSGGIYYRGYWGRPSNYYRGGYVGAYRGTYYRPGYVAPPYGGRTYVAPPARPYYGGGRGYVAPAPAYRAAPAYRVPAPAARSYAPAHVYRR